MRLIKWAIFIFIVVWLVRFGFSKVDISKLDSGVGGSWVTLSPVRGDGNETTMRFSAPRGESRIRWEATNAWSDQRFFSARLMGANGQQFRVMTNVGVPGDRTKSDEYFLRGVREFYLVINSNLSWQITVEVLK